MVGERVSPRLISSLILLGVICFTQSFRYDINAECQRLFNADLDSVVHRFRRTPEYLKILKDRYEETVTFIVDMEYRVFVFYLDQMQKRIAEIWELDLTKDNKNKSMTTTTEATTKDHALMLYFKSHRRTTMGLSTNKTHVERLDTYSMLNSTLSLSQRNAMRDMGFTYAKNIISAVIQNLGGGTHKVPQKPEEGKMGAAPAPPTVEETYEEYDSDYSYDYVNAPKSSKNVTGAVTPVGKKGNFKGKTVTEKAAAQQKKKRRKKKKQRRNNTTQRHH